MACKEYFDRGWSHASLINESGINEELRRVFSQRFMQVLFVPNHNYTGLSDERFYDVLVRGFPETPSHLNPRGDFMAVGSVGHNESVSDRYIRRLAEIVKQGSDDCIVEVVVLPGPAFYYTQELKNAQLARDPTAERVIWMSWDIPRAA